MGAKFIMKSHYNLSEILMSMIHDVTRDFFFTFSLVQSKRVSKFIVKLLIHKNQMQLQNYFFPIMHCISDCQPLKQLI